MGSKFATAVNSATSALHISCMALDIGSQDIVWTSQKRFVVSSNCALTVEQKSTCRYGFRHWACYRKLTTIRESCCLNKITIISPVIWLFQLRYVKNKGVIKKIWF